MKRILIILTLLCLIAFHAKGQDVFNEIYRLSEKAANDRSNTIEDRRINTFKVDALSYMKTKTLELMLEKGNDIGKVLNDSTVNKLNHQAYAMYAYINLFLKRMARCDKESQLNKVKRVFKETSINNPMYNDPDKDLVQAYCDNKDFVTQFSLDTDWEKALDEVMGK